MKNPIKLFLDILFPSVCISCRRHLEVDILGPVCKFCFDKIALNRSLPVKEAGAQIFYLGSYQDETLRKLIQALKYERVRTVDRTIEALIKIYFDKHSNALNTFNNLNALIVPIPLHPKRQRSRGFNQAEIVGRILSAKVGIKVESGILKRIKNTKPQANFKDLGDRAFNIQEAFKIADGAKEKLLGKNIVIVDDVYTSGSTVNEAIKVLKKNGAKKFTIFVLAKT